MPGRKGYGSGVCLTAKGYLQITRRGPDRNKLVHRAVMSTLCREWCVYPLNPKTGLPDGLEVHHVDFDKRHNCPENLMLLDPVLHKFVHVHTVPGHGDAPDWVTSDNYAGGNDGDNDW
jgi:hypothetical protein